MPIARRLLAEDEEVLVDQRPHWVSLLGPATLTVLALVGLVVVVVRYPHAPAAASLAVLAVAVVGAAWVALRLVRWWWSAHLVTTFRIIRRSGAFGRQLVEVPLSAVTGVRPRRRLRDRLVGSGSLRIDMAAAGRTWVITEVRRSRSVARVIVHQAGDATSLGGRATVGAWTSTPAGTSGSVRERLVELSDLYQRGLVTREEYEVKRAALLERL